MKKAIEIGREYSEPDNYVESDDEIYDRLGNLKVSINNLLHQYLPSDTTLGDAEIIAMTMFEIINESKDFIREAKSNSIKTV